MSYAVILAGGKSVRFKGNVPGQFVELTGEPLLVYPMKTAQENDSVDAICVVLPKEYCDRVETWADKYHTTKLLFAAETGGERYQSVHNGLKFLLARVDDAVIIMATACPFISQLTVNKLYKATETRNAYIIIVRVTDAITFNNNGESVLRILQKKGLFIQQGLQLLRYGILEQAYRAHLSDENRTEVNEDSKLVLNIRVECSVVIGDRFCIKVTYLRDLVVVEALCPLLIKQEAKVREGM